MAAFHVLVEASRLDVPAAELELASPGDERVAGFCTWRVVAAADESEAASQAIADVAAQWSERKYAVRSTQPRLTASEVRPLSWLARLRAKNTGFVFYPHE
jgi:hypothetical protein